MCKFEEIIPTVSEKTVCKMEADDKDLKKQLNKVVYPIDSNFRGNTLSMYVKKVEKMNERKTVNTVSTITQNFLPFFSQGYFRFLSVKVGETLRGR